MSTFTAFTNSLPKHRNPRRFWLLAVIAVISLVSASCSDGSDLDVAASTQAGATSETEPRSDEPPGTAETSDDDVAEESSAEPGHDGDAPASDDGATPDPDGPIRIETDVSFATGVAEGTFSVTAGSDRLGCSGGTLVDLEVNAGVLRTFTCDDADHQGDLVIFFDPNEGLEGPGELNARWYTRGSTGDFVGVDTEGLWAAQLVSGGAEAILTEAEPTGTEADPVALTDSWLAGLVDTVPVQSDGGGVLLATIGPDGAVAQASAGTDPDGTAPTVDDAFRIGSITKVFTALATLQLVDAGVLSLDAAVVDHVSRIEVPAGITVRDLLQHTSGLPNLTNRPDFWDQVFGDLGRRWAPEEAIDLITGRDQAFDPGSEFGYSNTNYIVLGVLIEEVTGQLYHEVVRNGILAPLDLTQTYLAGFETGSEPFVAYTGLMGPVRATDFDYTSNVTMAWAAGAMVSSATDLHTLFTALFDGLLVSEELTAQMTDNLLYGLGLELFEWSDGLVGHSGRIPGYITVVRHDADSGTTGFAVATGPDVWLQPALAPLYQAVAAQ